MIFARTPDWPEWVCGGTGHRPWDGIVSDRDHYWTNIDGILYLAQVVYKQVVSIKRFTVKRGSWHPHYVHWQKRDDAEQNLKEVMVSLPSFLVRWEL